MPLKLNKKKGEIAKSEIVKRFYGSARKTEFFPSGAIYLYRMTRTPPNPPKGAFTYQTVRVKNPEENAQLKLVLEYLGGKLQWQKLPPLLQKFEEQLKKKEDSLDPQTLKLVRQYPRASIAILKAFDEVYKGKIEVDDFPLMEEFVKTVLQSLSGKQRSMIDLQLELLDRLGEEKDPDGMQRLLKQLGQYSLPQLTSVTNIITDRLQRLRFFEKEIQNEKAYEIRGENSIHNQLKGALWLVDDAYWLLHSNEPLTNFLRKSFRDADDPEKDRPDFICATSESKLVIVELKRPSHKVTRKDINQLQDYLVTADEYAQPAYSEKEGYLVGNEISPRDQKVVNQIRGVQFVSYSRLVENCSHRYREYLDALDKEK